MAYQKTTFEGDLIIRNVLVTDIADFLDPMGFHTRAKYLYKIRDKDGVLQFYTPWEPQIIVDRVIREEYERSFEVMGIHQVFLIYLKARQEGLSTDTTLRMIDKMIFNESYFCQVLAHDGEGTSLLYNQYKRAFRNLPHFVQVVDQNGNPIEMGGSLWRIPIKPAGEPIKGGIKFKSLSMSELVTQTAGKGDNAGKAGSINAVHYSENANYEKHDDVVSSVNQMLGGTDIFGVKESTANGTTGIGQAFYDDWVSEEKAWLRYSAGENETFEGWRPLFLPWYWLSSYRKPLHNGKKVSLDGIEWESEKEKAEYLEWEEQIEHDIIPGDPEVDENSFDVREATNFYRNVIKTKCQRKLAKARRYYPTTPQEAFVTSDKCFFSTNKLFVVKSNLKVRNDSLGYKTGILDSSGKFHEKAGGPLKVKRFPEEQWQNRYVISCDQSKGYEEGDYSDMSVFDRVDREWVAYWNDSIPETQLAVEFTKMGYFWQNGLLVPEENRMTVINLIKPDGHERYMGELYYKRENITTSGRREPKWGYQMNVASRKYLIDKLLAFLEADEESGEVPMDEILRNYPKLFTEEQVNEYLNFIRTVSGGRSKFQAAPGHKDDIVIGDALTLIGDEWWDRSPIRKGVSRKGHTNKVLNIKVPTSKYRSGNNGVRQSGLGKRKKKYDTYVGGKKRQSQLGR